MIFVGLSNFISDALTRKLHDFLNEINVENSN